MLLIQGKNDQYGTLRQLEKIQAACKGQVGTVIFDECGHSPHRDHPEQTMSAVTSFLKEEVLR